VTAKLRKDPNAVTSARVSKKGSVTRKGRKRFLDRSSLDGRTITAKIYDRLVDEIVTDLGGADRLSAIERKLVESFTGASVVLEHLNVKIVSGAAIDNALISAYAQITSAMVRLSAKLGVERRARPVLDLDSFLDMRERAKRVTTGPLSARAAELRREPELIEPEPIDE
jgi:hypothetical protein